jgi:hypothetical protein
VLSARNAPRVNVNRVNFAVNPGAVVPSHVNVVSVRAFPTLIDVFPSFRDDSFFVVEDEIVFLDRDRRVVDVVPAGPRTHFSNRFSRGSVGSGAVATLNLSPTEIREVQQVLIERGLLTGEADGVLGSRTQEALISFQRQQGIQTTGSIDTRTVAALGLSNRIGQQSGQTITGSQSSTVGQSQTGTQQNTTGQANGQANAPMPQDQSTTTRQGSGQAQGQAQGQEQGQAQQPSAQQQPPAQQNTTGQAAPQNQSTVGQAGNQPAANQNMQSGQGAHGSGPAPSSSGQDNSQPPAQNSGQKNPAGR